MAGGITIRNLVFTGPAVEPAELHFDDGLNIIYGASNTGKSFATKALSFMLAASKDLPKTEEVTSYDAVWLGLTLPDGNGITLYRATNGGSFRLHQGLVNRVEKNAGIALLDKSDAKRTDTVSHYLLQSLGLAGKVIVIDANAQKENLSIRLLAPYVVVSEEDIMSERSPVLFSRQYADRTLEKNLFRLFLTGNDDTAAVTVTSKKVRDVATTAKVELVDELIAQIDEELGDRAPDREELGEQIGRIETSLRSLHDNLRSAQSQLDNLAAERRVLIDSRRDLAARGGELDVTLQRFGHLSDVYTSDIARLEAIEEGGFALMAMADRDCPICGATPSAQRHNHAADEIERSHSAAAAEVRKIRIEQRELRQTIASLEAEAKGFRRRADQLLGKIKEVDQRIEEARPTECSAREVYENLSNEKAELDRIEDLFVRRDRLLVRRSQIQEQPTKRKKDKLVVGIDGTIAYAFGETVRQVLEAWRFPNAGKVLFDTESNDITIGGKFRSANGKGVRAILHAAFNVAVLIFCRSRGLPHPGFLVLDTPLLTYREPLTSKYGELSDDEAELKRTSLATHFYTHLASLKGLAQVIIIENSDPPNEARDLARIETFTGRLGSGRYGLFPRSPGLTLNRL